MPNITYIQTILSYFTSMDIAKIRLYLKDEYTYEDTTKEKFLNVIESIFEAHRYSGDTKLIIYKGACAGSKICDNCGKKGYRFVGNHSKNYMDLLFEIEGDDIRDIYSCSYFKPDAEIERLQTKADIYINLDERVTFIKPPGYNTKVYAATSAYTEIITSPPKRIDFEELSNWLDDHTYTNTLIGSFDVFDPLMKWTPFSMLFADLQEIRSYISSHIDDFIQANSLINQIQTEQDLINWLLKYEAIYEKAPSNLTYGIEKEDANYTFNKRTPILFTGEVFSLSIGFFEYYQKHNEDLLKKYSTYTKEEYIELCNNHDFGNESINIFSLRFYLEKRKSMEDIGVNIPFYINKYKQDPGI